MNDVVQNSRRKGPEFIKVIYPPTNIRIVIVLVIGAKEYLHGFC